MLRLASKPSVKGSTDWVITVLTWRGSACVVVCAGGVDLSSTTVSFNLTGVLQALINAALISSKAKDFDDDFKNIGFSQRRSKKVNTIY
jgi:hypothetical protein